MELIQSYFQIRAAAYKDIPAIADITREAFTEYAHMSPQADPEALRETEADIKRDIDTKIVLIAVRDDTPVGSVRIAVDKETETAYLSRFAVKLTAQNSGIGKSLMKMVDELMQKYGVKRLSLHTDSKLAPLIRFYYGRGFYIESTDTSRGYVRAHLVKEYK